MNARIYSSQTGDLIGIARIDPDTADRYEMGTMPGHEGHVEAESLLATEELARLGLSPESVVWAEMDWYSGYTLPVSMDPSCYGDCTPEEAEAIAFRLANMARLEFPGLRACCHRAIGSGRVTGPDLEICDAISRWVEDNWTRALNP